MPHCTESPCHWPRPAGKPARSKRPRWPSMAPVKADARNPEYGIHDCLNRALLPLRQMDRMQVQGVMLVLLMLAAGLSVKLPRGQRRGRLARRPRAPPPPSLFPAHSRCMWQRCGPIVAGCLPLRYQRDGGGHLLHSSARPLPSSRLWRRSDPAVSGNSLRFSVRSGIPGLCPRLCAASPQCQQSQRPMRVQEGNAS